MQKIASALLLMTIAACAAEPIPGTDKVLEHIRKAFPQTIKERKDDQGDLIGVPHPFTSPCAKDTFKELFYWDTYFMNVGMLRIGMQQQAKNNTESPTPIGARCAIARSRRGWP